MKNSNTKTPTKKEFLNDLYLFYRLFIASNYKDDVPAPHIKQLSRKLMALRNGEGKSRLAVSMPPRHDIEKNTPIYTSNKGWITHGELEAGDYVIHPSGKPIEVLKILPDTLANNLLEFSNGDKIICGDYHTWKLYDEITNKTELYYTNQLNKKDLFLNNTYQARYKIKYKGKCISLINISKLNEPLLSNCIEVNSNDGMYLVGKNRTPTHNSKSSMVTLAFPLWLIFQNPDVNIMIVTGSPRLSDKFGIQLREYVRELGKYFNVYLSDVKQSSTHLMFCDANRKLYRGNLILASSGGGITGQDADYLIVDDPYRGNDDEFTPSALQKKIDWANRVIEQRIEPHTKYCILHTRWHSRDLIGYYKEEDPDSYDFVEFPALDEHEEPLWKQRYSKEELLKKKKVVGERVFQSVYQQQPIDATSDFFNMQHLKFGLPDGFDIQSSCRAWDIASSDALSNNDFTAGAKLYRYDDYCVISDLVHGRFGGKTPSVVKTTAVEDTPNVHVVVETGVAAAGKLLFEEWQNQLEGFIVKQAKVSGGKSKIDRATPFKNAMEDGKVYVNITNPELRQVMIDELSSFPNGQYDDITDAISHGFNYLFMSDDVAKKATAKMRVIHI